MRHSGRLELTWTNKDRRLHTTPEGGYQWVDPNDPRVTEVRLIDEVATVGEPDVDNPNILIQGDALHALTALNRIPELAARYAGKVRLVYIDPPFNTGQAFENYDDNLEHSVWLSMLRDRLEQVRPLLASNGSVWVHLDDAEVHRCRCVMDEVLGASNFVSSIVWQKRTSRDNRAAFSSQHDHLLVYAARAPGSRWAMSRNRLPDSGDYTNPDGDLRGPWRSVPMSAQAGRATKSQFYAITTPTGVVHQPPPGRAWTYTRPRFEQLVAANMIYWPRNGNGKPRLKRFPDGSTGLVPFTIWPSSEVGENADAKSHIQAMFPDVPPFSTPKPEALLHRVIHIATNPGDLVLDCFGGSGTTAAVALKTSRRWVMVERETATVEQFTRPRLDLVVKGEDPGGITEAVGWEGGQGFAVGKVGTSMFDFDLEGGYVYMADRTTNGQFARSCAAHLGFTEEPRGPFIGRKGRTWLAALDGVVGPPEVEHILGLLDEGERTVIVAKVLTDGAESRLRELSPGSRLRHAPNDLVGGRIP